MKTITTHYIDGAFVDSHGHEVMDSINPTNGKVIGQITLGDEHDARQAIAAAKRAFESFSLTVHLPQARVSDRDGLHGGHQAERARRLADAGLARVPARGGTSAGVFAMS